MLNKEFVEYLGEWYNILPLPDLCNVLEKLSELYKTKKVYPAINNIFKAFNLCSLDKLKIVILGQDPYPTKDLATGLAFANNSNSIKLSPSLEILKRPLEVLQNGNLNYTFDPSLENLAKEGILLLNSALTVEAMRPESHLLLWHEFTKNLLINLSFSKDNVVYILLGAVAKSFECYISHKNNIVYTEYHPSYYVRKGMNMPVDIFEDINKLLKLSKNETNVCN